MAPKRSAASRPSNQPTLAFHGRSSKITKPATRSGSKKLSGSPTFKPVPPASEDRAPDQSTLPIETQVDPTPATAPAAARSQALPTPEEEAASKLNQAQISKYWRAKEKERKAPRVHQQDLNVQDKILREWDISGQYGPSIGIPRVQRWKRAHRLGLNPPLEVLSVILSEQDKSGDKAQKSHVDELLS